MNSIVLAFVGDAVYSLYTREKLALSSDSKANALNKLASETVRATAQAEYFDLVSPILTEDEMAIYKRARNSHKSTKSKSASVGEYNKSTGFEALIGFLYVTGNYDRLNYLLNYKEENK